MEQERRFNNIFLMKVGVVILITIVFFSAIILLILKNINLKKTEEVKLISSNRPSATPFQTRNPSPTLSPDVTNDYNQLVTKILDHIETQKSGSYYKDSNNSEKINYHANSYIASLYFDLFQKKGQKEYLDKSIGLLDALMKHCQEEGYQKDCYFILAPFFELDAHEKNQPYQDFIEKNLLALTNYTPQSLTAYAHLSKEYLYYSYYFEKSYFQKANEGYQKALDFLPNFPQDIGLLLQVQQRFYEVTRKDDWLKTSTNFFDNFDKDSYNKMRTNQKIFVLTALQNLKNIQNSAKYNLSFTKLLNEFIQSNLQKSESFVCLDFLSCNTGGSSLIIDNALFLDLLINE